MCHPIKSQVAGHCRTFEISALSGKKETLETFGGTEESQEEHDIPEKLDIREIRRYPDIPEHSELPRCPLKAGHSKICKGTEDSQNNMKSRKMKHPRNSELSGCSRTFGTSMSSQKDWTFGKFQGYRGVTEENDNSEKWDI